MHRSADLPVAIALPGRLGAEVSAFVESEGGWQVVAVDGPLVPALVLSDGVRADGPCVVVSDVPLPAERVRDALQAGAVDVVVWPDERERLLAAPGLLRPLGTAAPATAVLRVGGCRGGVGTSTVALAIGATVAWAGGRALVVGDEPLARLAGLAPWRGPGTAELAALGRFAAHEVTAVARDVPGVPGLQLVAGGGGVTDTSGWPYDLVVADVGVAGSGAAMVVVGAADASLVAGAQADVVLVVAHGPLDRSGVRAALGRAPDGWLPYAHRVARAGSTGRVPSALPGSWVAAMTAAVAGAVAASGRAGWAARRRPVSAT
jgi:hypothetical protein